MKKAKILWMDLEMTGLDSRSDLILEVAALATDWNFKELNSFVGVIKQPDTELEQKLANNSDFWDKNPEARDGLLSQNATGESLEAIEQTLIKFIDDNFKNKTKILLAGNSIHQDRAFINFYWPELAKKLHYRMLDVSAWKVVFEGKFKNKFAKPENHRALDDIKGSIEELEYYLNKAKFNK